MVASAMILMVLIALTMATKSSLKGNQDIHLRASALFLAQEGIEAVRGIRDNNWSSNSGAGWKALQWSGNTLVEVDLTNPSCYKIEFKEIIKSFGLTAITCPGNVGDTVAQESVQIEIDNPDTFYRYIKIESAGGLGDSIANDDNALKATAHVTYGDGKQVSVSELLTDWLPKY
ncbi:MAG: hypothetical protein WC227_02515 [Patescibacteria group bacterium]